MKQQQHSPPSVTPARLPSHWKGVCSVLTTLLSAPRSAPTPAGAGWPPACSHTCVAAATQVVSILLLLLLHSARRAPCIKAPACMQGGRTPQCHPVPRGLLRSAAVAADLAAADLHVSALSGWCCTRSFVHQRQLIISWSCHRNCLNRYWTKQNCALCCAALW